MGGLIAYLDHAGKGRLPFLQPPVQRHAGMHLMIDAATRESLEITQTMAGLRAGSLLGAIDRTVTGAGARFMGADLSATLMDRQAIEPRLAPGQWLLEEDTTRGTMGGAL